MLSFLVGGFHDKLQLLEYDGLDLSRTTAEIENTGCYTWILPSSSPNSFYGLQALPDSQGVAHFFRFTDGEEIELKVLDSITTSGSDPCHGCVADNYLWISNYDSSNLCRVALNEDGTFDRSRVFVHQLTGSGPDASRQEAAHPHSVYWLPTLSRCLILDLGADLLRFFKDDKEIAAVPCKAGDGPRHMAANSQYDIIYVVNELANTVSVYALTEEGADFVSSVSILPTGAHGKGMGASAILISPDNRFIYVTNRLEDHPQGDAIVWLSVAEDGKTLAKAGELRTGLDHPRGAQLSNDGAFLVTGSKTRKGAVLYARDAATGALTVKARNLDVAMPSSFVQLD